MPGIGVNGSISSSLAPLVASGPAVIVTVLPNVGILIPSASAKLCRISALSPESRRLESVEEAPLLRLRRKMGPRVGIEVAMMMTFNSSEAASQYGTAVSDLS